jgi:hypothetical protein
MPKKEVIDKEKDVKEVTKERSLSKFFDVVDNDPKDEEE